MDSSSSTSTTSDADAVAPSKKRKIEADTVPSSSVPTKPADEYRFLKEKTSDQLFIAHGGNCPQCPSSCSIVYSARNKGLRLAHYAKWHYNVDLEIKKQRNAIKEALELALGSEGDDWRVCVYCPPASGEDTREFYLNRVAIERHIQKTHPHLVELITNIKKGVEIKKALIMLQSATRVDMGLPEDVEDEQKPVAAPPSPPKNPAEPQQANQTPASGLAPATLPQKPAEPGVPAPSAQQEPVPPANPAPTGNQAPPTPRQSCCRLCDQHHRTKDCPNYFTVRQRRRRLRELHRCFCCLEKVEDCQGDKFDPCPVCPGLIHHPIVCWVQN